MTVALHGEAVARKRQKTVTVTARLNMLRPQPGALSVSLPNPLKGREVVVALAENLSSQMPWGSRRIKWTVVLTLLLFDAISIS